MRCFEFIDATPQCLMNGIVLVEPLGVIDNYIEKFNDKDWKLTKVIDYRIEKFGCSSDNVLLITRK